MRGTRFGKCPAFWAGVVLVFGVVCGSLTADRCAAAESSGEVAAENILPDPLRQIEELVFAVRLGYDDPHWYANIGYYCDDENQKAYAGNGLPDEGKLCKLNLRTGEMSVLLDAEGGSIRDPEVHYDAQKVLFSFRKAGTDFYHLYELNLDGTGLRQITSGEFDDYEPAYLPDGGIVFVSTRCQCWVSCWKTQVGVLYRCNADGSDLLRLSHNPEHDNTPAVLPDGRILYTRWEYVDRSQVEFHHLWTMNPDGTGQMVYYGNMQPGIVMIDAKPIPETTQILASFSPGHGATDHQGIATVVSPAQGPDSAASVRRLHPGPLIKDPFPLTSDWFLAARNNQILVMEGTGKNQLLYEWKGSGAIHEPRPVVRREREPIIPPQIAGESATGQLLLGDIYEGRNLEGVQRGEIRKLLVLEVLPKPVNFSGGPDLVSWLGTFSLERVLGTVPVESDGSANLELPAGRPLFFVALDEHDRSVKRMHSFVSVMPGEVTSCVGCHEQRTQGPRAGNLTSGLAFRRPPSPIEPFEGLPDVVDFPRDIQPILDRHCVSCHNDERREGGVLLTGDLGTTWSHSFFSLFAHRQVADGRNGLGNSPPRTVGSSASPLMNMLEESHYGVRISDQEWRLVWMWIESGAPYAGSYAGLRNAVEQERDNQAAASVFVQGNDVLQRRCRSCHAVGDMQNETGRAIPFYPDITKGRGLTRPKGNFERIVLEDDPLAHYSPHILLNLSRPHRSALLLAPLATAAGGWGSCGSVFQRTDDVDYQQLLDLIETARAHANVPPRYGQPGFQPNPQYLREMQRFGILSQDFALDEEPVDFFALDQAYWRSLWHHPQ